MKKTALPKKLSLRKESIATLTRDQLRAPAGAAPSILPPSLFACGFTLWCD